jgi:hypothetical protein
MLNKKEIKKTSITKDYVEKCSEYYLSEHKIYKRHFLIKKTYVTFKPMFYKFYLDKQGNMQIRLEEWLSITKDNQVINKISSIKNNVLEGEQISWE